MDSSRLTSLSGLYFAVFISCVIVCKTNTATLAVCNIQDVDEIENGFYTLIGQNGVGDVSVVRTGEEITVTCDSGYSLQGCQKLRCEEDGVFQPVVPNFPMPFCMDIDECRTVASNIEPEYSLYSNSLSSNYEEEAENECTSLYDQVLPLDDCHENAQCVNTFGSYICRCDEDYVGDGVNTCEYDPPECDVLPPPLNGYIKKNTSRATAFKCNDGYAVRGSRKRTCKRDGWDGVQPTCQRTGCGDPGTPKDGYKYGDRYEPGNSVKFVCNASYTLEGSDIRVCTDEKRWNGWQPVCKPPKTIGDIAVDIRGFVDKYDQYTDSSRGRLSRGKSVGLELVFAFDKSSSVGIINFQRGLNFTKKLIQEFGVDYESFGGTRVAAVSFASDAKLEFNFGDDVDTEEEVFSKLDAMEGTLGGGTAMKEALEMVVLEIIDDMRNNSKKALFIVTDGHANTEDPVAIAENLRKKFDFEIFAVGVGNDVDREQIRTVASPPYTSHVFLINSFEDLARITEIIAEKRTDFTRCGVAGDWELPDGTNEANSNAWPWLANVYREEDYVLSFYCDAALICEQWVVVAASCLDGNPLFNEQATVPKEKLLVKFGDHNFVENEGCEQNATVVEIHRPETYNNETMDSDIALLKLDHRLQLVNCIRTICLPTDNDFFNFQPNRPDRCFLSGWGSKNLWQQHEEGTFPRSPSILPHQVKLPLVANINCEKIAGVELTENMMCAGKRYKSEEEECTGQVGSPLVCRRDDDSWSMMGVLSDGSGCSENNDFSYFTQVHNYIEWINTVTESCHAEHVVEPVGGF